jgi:hypothetical protein
LGSFLEITEVASFFSAFSTIKFFIFLTKNGLGYILGVFSQAHLVTLFDIIIFLLVLKYLKGFHSNSVNAEKVSKEVKELQRNHKTPLN